MKHKYAFTLIELLVVVAVIALLVALLLPALTSAQVKVKVIVCQSGLRQISLASMQYSQDYRNALLPCLIYTGPYPSPWYGITWGSLLSGWTVNSVVSGSSCGSASYYAYLPAADMGYDPTHPNAHKIICPADTHMNYGNDYWSWGTNPSFNNTYVCWQTSVPVKITAIYNPAARMFFADHWSYAMWSWEVPPTSAYPMDYRHAGGINMAFLDGHVEWRPATIPNYGVSPPW